MTDTVFGIKVRIRFVY